MLLSDGSVTRHLQLMTDQRVEARAGAGGLGQPLGRPAVALKAALLQGGTLLPLQGRCSIGKHN